MRKRSRARLPNALGRANTLYAAHGVDAYIVNCVPDLE
jgi:hypothetical protein